mgnify:CR=1 FL=1
MAQAIYPLRIGATFETFLSDDDGIAASISGVQAQLRACQAGGTTVDPDAEAFDMEVAYVAPNDPDLGGWSIILTDEDSSMLKPGRYQLDALISYVDGRKKGTTPIFVEATNMATRAA